MPEAAKIFANYFNEAFRMANSTSQFDPTIISKEILKVLENNQQTNHNINTANTQDNAAPAQKENLANNQNNQQSESAIIQTETIYTPSNSSPISGIGTFGWIGIGFLLCLIFALRINIYLKIQKREMDAQPTKGQLESIAPGAMMG